MEKSAQVRTRVSTKLVLLAAAASCGAALWGTGRLPRAGAGTASVVPGLCLAARAIPPTRTAAFPHGSVTGTLSSGRILAGGSGEMFLSVDIETRPEAGVVRRAPVDLAVVIDRSGSMQGEKLESARQAARGLVERLSSDDRVSVVQYDDAAQVVVPLTALDGAGRERIGQGIAGIAAGGGTNLHAGLLLGRDQVSGARGDGRVIRVILLSDGQANIGETNPRALGDVARQAAEKGVRLSTVGIGLDYNEDLMETLAENGRGRYHYVKDAGDLQGVFAGEIASMQATVATAAELRLEPSCAGVEIVSVFGYEIRRASGSVPGAVVVPMADLFAGDKRRVLARLRVPADRQGPLDLVGVRLAYTDARTRVASVTPIALGAEVSTDARAVAASTDKNVVAGVLEVESARVMREAARAYEQGDRASAKRLLEETERNVGKAQAEFDLAPAQASGALWGVADLKNEIAAFAPGSAGGKHALKLGKQMAQSKMKQRAQDIDRLAK